MRLLAVLVLATLAFACARPQRAPRQVETTSAEVPSGSGGPSSAWTTSEGGPASPGTPSVGNVVQTDGGVR